MSVVVAHCISYAPKVCSHCSRFCCCLLLYDRQRMGIRLNSARGPGLYHRSRPLSFLHLPSIPSSQWLLSISPGCLAQSVTCLATDACLTADPGVASSIPARYHTFMEIDHEIISTVILLPSADLFKKGCCQLQAKVCAQITG